MPMKFHGFKQLRRIHHVPTVNGLPVSSYGLLAATVILSGLVMLIPDLSTDIQAPRGDPNATAGKTCTVIVGEHSRPYQVPDLSRWRCALLASFWGGSAVPGCTSHALYRLTVSRRGTSIHAGSEICNRKVAQRKGI